MVLAGRAASAGQRRPWTRYYSQGCAASAAWAWLAGPAPSAAS